MADDKKPTPNLNPQDPNYVAPAEAPAATDEPTPATEKGGKK